MKKFNLDETTKHPKVTRMAFDRKGYYFWGPTGQGKTHYSGWLLMDLIMSATKMFVWGRVSIKDLFNAWEHIRSDIEELRDAAFALLKRVRLLDVVILEDIDKAGNFTVAREEEFSAMLDKFYERGVKLIVNANYSIDDFGTLKLPADSTLKERDGKSPVCRRFQDLCDEVYLNWR